MKIPKLSDWGIKIQAAIILIFVFCIRVSSQFEYRIEGFFQDWIPDPLDQIIVTTPQQIVKKYSIQGQMLCEFSQQALGKITWIDAKDPFNTLVFYKNAQTLVLLDKSFYPVGEIQFSSLDFIEISLITLGNEKNIWVYDSGFQKLFKLSSQGKIQIETSPMSLFFKTIPVFEKIWVNSSGIYLFDKKYGISEFDLLGRFIKTISLPEVNEIEAFFDFFYFKKDESLWKLNLGGGDPQPIHIEMEFETSKSNIKLGDKFFFISTNNEIKAFKYEN